jgi:hypothetical protein
VKKEAEKGGKRRKKAEKGGKFGGRKNFKTCVCVGGSEKTFEI